MKNNERLQLLINNVNSNIGLEKYDVLFDEINELIKDNDIITIKQAMQEFVNDSYDRGVKRTVLVCLKQLYFSESVDTEFKTLFENISNQLKIS